VEICTETFGDPNHPAALLIMGATASMLWWPDEFCAALSRTGLFVIRYDNRDTGQSTTRPAGVLDYTIDDMAQDAVAVLDDHDVGRAHLIGMSLGGMIAQLVALTAPERVLSLTAISSSAVGEDDPDLPPINPAFLAHFQTLENLDWTDRNAVVAFQVESARLSANDDERFDVASAIDRAEREFNRARDPRSAMNHGQLSGGEAWAHHEADIRVPALVLHGAKDPILSLKGARKLAATLPDARLRVLEGGHELNRADWPNIIDDIAAVTQRAAGSPGPTPARTSGGGTTGSR
jgi:pimeloyl-ACP methyl ester carboxylesterase